MKFNNQTRFLVASTTLVLVAGCSSGVTSSETSSNGTSDILSAAEAATFIAELDALFDLEGVAVEPDDYPTGSVVYSGNSLIISEFLGVEEGPASTILGSFEANVDFGSGQSSVDIGDLALYEFANDVEDVTQLTADQVTVGPAVDGSFSGSGENLLPGLGDTEAGFVLTGAVSGQTIEGAEFAISGEVTAVGVLIENDGAQSLVLAAGEDQGQDLTVTVDGVATIEDGVEIIGIGN